MSKFSLQLTGSTAVGRRAVQAWAARHSRGTLDLKFAAYGDVPAEPVLEDRLPNAMHVIQIADVALCVVFGDNSYHRSPHPVLQDGTLPGGEHPLKLSTLTGMLHAAGMREVGAGRA